VHYRWPSQLSALLSQPIFTASTTGLYNNSKIQCLSLGFAYHFGEAVPKDWVEGLKWFRKAAEQNNASAQFSLGLRYLVGEGVPKNEIKALAWFNIAAASGTLKTELIFHRRFATRQQAIREITEYIEVFYNRQRLQRQLDYLSPVAFERRYYEQRLAA
jgi:TPR repeat protein